jgi:predicted RNase H-like HicB family nuclease
MSDLEYPVAIVRLPDEEGGGYLARAVDLFGCLGDGQTPEEALANLKDAIIEWIDECRRLERDIPQPGSVILKAQKKQRETVAAIRKQNDLINKQAEAFEQLRQEIACLKSDIAELADKGDEDDGPIWGCNGDSGVITVKVAKHSCISH